MMNPAIRKLNLTAHIVLSVSWIGAAFAFFVLSIVGLTSKDGTTVRGVYLSTNLICLYSIIPLSLMALATGLIQSLGTRWGLFRHYWVSAKLVLTTLSVAVLLIHQFAAVAKAAKLVSEGAAGTLSQADLGRVGLVLVRASGLGIVVLLAVTVLSVYKPWGLTPYGEGKRQARWSSTDTETQLSSTMAISGNSSPRSKMWIAFAIAALVVTAVFLHLHGHVFHHAH